jgi:hypothetical protein
VLPVERNFALFLPPSTTEEKIKEIVAFVERVAAGLRLYNSDTSMSFEPRAEGALLIITAQTANNVEVLYKKVIAEIKRMTVPPKPHMTATDEKIVAFLAAHPEGTFTAEEIAASIGITAIFVRQRLRKLLVYNTIRAAGIRYQPRHPYPMQYGVARDS